MGSFSSEKKHGTAWRFINGQANSINDSFSPEEQEVLDKRMRAFPEIVKEIEPGIIDLAAAMGHKSPSQVLEDLETCLQLVDRYLQTTPLEELTRDQAIWLGTRLAYLTIELIVQRHGGYPYLQEDRGSDFFLHYVVGNFEDGTPQTIIVEPFELARALVQEPRSKNRTLAAAISALNLGPATS